MQHSKRLVTADYDAQSAVERELVLRLASLLWRLRRATTIESGLFSYPLDRLSRYEATLWRQACQILFTLQYLHRRKPWERIRIR